MVKYYVRITDEEPPEDEMALWFVLNTDDENSAEFFALRRNEFDDYITDLESRFANVQSSYNQAHSDFENNVINSYVAPAVTEYMNTLENVENSTNANNLVDPSNSSNKYTYSSLKTNLTNIQNDYNTKLGYKLDKSKVDSSLSLTSQNPVQNKVISEELSKKASASIVETIGNDISLKADTTHTHTGWINVTLNNYCWLRHNPQLRLVEFRYYRSGYNFSSTSTIKLHSIWNSQPQG